MNRLTDGQPAWRDGRWSAARWHPSPNWGPRPSGAIVDLLVVHSISLPPGLYGGHAVLDFFANQLDWSADPYYETIRGLQVSAHFFIQRDGEVWQCVDIGLRAWHAGASFYRGRNNCNDDSVGIELEGLEGDEFTVVQYQSLATLCRALAARMPIRHVAGHEHIAPIRKADPGPGFDWRHLQRLLGWSSQCFP